VTSRRPLDETLRPASAVRRPGVPAEISLGRMSYAGVDSDPRRRYCGFSQIGLNSSYGCTTREGRQMVLAIESDRGGEYPHYHAFAQLQRCRNGRRRMRASTT
jgi:hypothetical protein